MPEKFTLKVFYDQLKAARKMGPLSSVFSMIGAADMPKEMVQQSETKLKKFESIINSMTPEEREDAHLLRKNKSRIERIAKGAAVRPEDVRDLLSQFEKVEGMMKSLKGNRGLKRKLEKMMKGGKLPEGLA
jgi:signal recognition particle subunit SRP54